jgi:hypothetical protein
VAADKLLIAITMESWRDVSAVGWHQIDRPPPNEVLVAHALGGRSEAGGDGGVPGRGEGERPSETEAASYCTVWMQVWRPADRSTSLDEPVHRRERWPDRKIGGAEAPLHFQKLRRRMSRTPLQTSFHFASPVAGGEELE